jgi:hypothetical protein
VRVVVLCGYAKQARDNIHRMWGELVNVTEVRGDAVTERRKGLGLSKAETARRMYAHIAAEGPGARDGLALTRSGFAWATESACRRAVDDLEGSRRHFKEAQYVDALLAVLDLRRDDVGLEG